MKPATDAITGITALVIALGSLWLALYFARVVHAVPNADFGKLAIAIGLIGVLGIRQILLIAIAFALPALLVEMVMALRESQPPGPANGPIDANAFVRRFASVMFVGAGGDRPFRYYLVIAALTVLFLFLLEVAHAPYAFAVFAAGLCVTGVAFALLDRERAPAYVGALGYIVMFPIGLAALAPPTDNDPTTVITTLVTIAILASYLNMALAFRGFVRLAATAIVVVMLLLYGNVDLLLGAPIRQLNLGYGLLNFTMTTHHAAQTAKDCGYESVGRRHYTVFVLSNFGDTYVIDCPPTHRAMVIPKEEALQRTIVFPNAEIPATGSPRGSARIPHR